MDEHVFAVELCAGGGGQALGIEQAGFDSAAVLEIDPHACSTLRANRPAWNVVEGDIAGFDGTAFSGIELLAGGVPCPPFSVAGKQLGKDDDRDLFPEAVRIISEARPKAFLLENVAGFASEKFRFYRLGIMDQLARLGYFVEGKILQASDFGVPQLRPRFVMVGLKQEYNGYFRWPVGEPTKRTVGTTIADLLSSQDWPGAPRAIQKASRIAPTIVGGSKKHGGPDLGPTRAKRQWAELGIDGKGLANEAPGPDFPFEGHPRLTVRMVARLQGFPDDWHFCGGKTASYRQVGNAFPPPVAAAICKQLRIALEKSGSAYRRSDSVDGQFQFLETASKV